MLGRSIILLLAGLGAALPAIAALPVADAGGKQFETRYVAVGQPVTLNGSGSYGRSCELAYAWTLVAKPAGSSAGLANAGSVAPTFVPDQPGDYVINLVVGEAGGSSDPASVTVSAISPSPYPLPARNADRWMGLINGLMDRTLPQITLPGTHDSAAYWLSACEDADCRGPDFNDQGFNLSWFLDILAFGSLDDVDAIKNEVARDVALAHGQTLLQQLQGGIRSLDLRVTKRGAEFYVYHGLLGHRLGLLLQDIREFMEQEQSSHELLVVSVSHLAVGTHETSDKRAFSDYEHQQLMQYLVDQLGPYLYPRNGRSAADLRATPLGQMVADGPKVLLIYGDEYFYKCDNTVCDFGNARNDPHFERFWHVGAWQGGYTDTEKLGVQIAGQKAELGSYLAGSRESGFALFQTLTVSTDYGDSVSTNAINCRVGQHLPWYHPVFPTSHLAAKLLLLQSCDRTRTLHQLSRSVNPDLPRLLAVDILPSGVAPALILVDFHDESAVVSEAIRLNQRDTISPTSEATRHPAANRYGGGFEDVTVTMTAADEQGGSGVAGTVHSLSGAHNFGPAEYCGAEKQVVVKAKGTTIVSYYAVDRAGNTGPVHTVQVRIDQQCDFNRDGRVDMADYSGLRHSLDDRSLWAVGDLNSDGQMSHQEWTSCLYKVLGRSR